MSILELRQKFHWIVILFKEIWEKLFGISVFHTAYHGMWTFGTILIGVFIATMVVDIVRAFMHQDN